MMLKQHKTGTFLGTLKLTLMYASPYITWIQLALVAIMSYYTTIGPLFKQWGIEFPFWVFLMVLGGLIVAVLLLEYIYMMLSYLGAFNIQQWYAKNPQRELLESMEADIKAMRQEIAELKNK